MTALRSRRLETVFGTVLDKVDAFHIHSLLGVATEAFDLDFKGELYGANDKQKHEVCKDISAMANTAGGVILLGVEEDSQAMAINDAGVVLSDGEIARIRQIAANGISPLPDFEIVPVLKDSAVPGHGFYLIIVPRSPAAPHAVVTNGDSLKYAKRHGTTSRWLSEPEVAAAYRERWRMVREVSNRAATIEQEAADRLDLVSEPWVLVTLVPDLPGDLQISFAGRRHIEQEILRTTGLVAHTGRSFSRVYVGHRRYIADVDHQHNKPVKRLLTELHADGSGVYAVQIYNFPPGRRFSLYDDERVGRVIDDEMVALAVLSGLHRLARHARDRAAAGGSALIRARLVGMSQDNPVQLGTVRGDGGLIGPQALSAPTRAAESSAALDELADPGPALVAAAAHLGGDLVQSFGAAELLQFTLDGRIAEPYWGLEGRAKVCGWASDHGIEVEHSTRT